MSPRSCHWSLQSMSDDPDSSPPRLLLILALGLPRLVCPLQPRWCPTLSMDFDTNWATQVKSFLLQRQEKLVWYQHMDLWRRSGARRITHCKSLGSSQAGQTARSCPPSCSHICPSSTLSACIKTIVCTAQLTVSGSPVICPMLGYKEMQRPSVGNQTSSVYVQLTGRHYKQRGSLVQL